MAVSLLSNVGDDRGLSPPRGSHPVVPCVLSVQYAVNWNLLSSLHSTRGKACSLLDFNRERLKRCPV